jgi:hypothetical protein
VSQIFPERIDNTYRGYRTALVILGVLLVIKAMMSVNSIVNGYAVAIGADGIPLDTFSPAATRAVVALFASWGFAHLALTIVGLLVLFRYRSAVPFMFALMLAELAGRKVVQQVLSGATTPAVKPAYYVNLILLSLMSVGLVLSLLKRPVAVAA